MSRLGLGALPALSIIFAVLDPTLTAAAIVTVIFAFGAMVVQIINATSAAKDRREAAAERQIMLQRAEVAAEVAKITNQKTDAIIESTTKIHELTNSTASNLQKALELMTAKNAALEDIIAQAEATKKESEMARQISDVKIQAALQTPVPATHEVLQTSKGDVKDAIAESPHLKEIGQTTAQTVENTKKG